MQNLAASYPAMPGDTSLNDAMERIKRNAKWLEENEKPITDWLTAVNAGLPPPMSDAVTPEVKQSRARRDVTSGSLFERDQLPYQNAV